MGASFFQPVENIYLWNHWIPTFNQSNMSINTFLNMIRENIFSYSFIIFIFNGKLREGFGYLQNTTCINCSFSCYWSTVAKGGRVLYSQSIQFLNTFSIRVSYAFSLILGKVGRGVLRQNTNKHGPYVFAVL